MKKKEKNKVKEYDIQGNDEMMRTICLVAEYCVYPMTAV
jgi:hypothetical protein